MLWFLSRPSLGVGAYFWSLGAWAGIRLFRAGGAAALWRVSIKLSLWAAFMRR